MAGSSSSVQAGRSHNNDPQATPRHSAGAITSTSKEGTSTTKPRHIRHSSSASSLNPSTTTRRRNGRTTSQDSTSQRRSLKSSNSMSNLTSASHQPSLSELIRDEQSKTSMNGNGQTSYFPHDRYHDDDYNPFSFPPLGQDDFGFYPPHYGRPPTPINLSSITSSPDLFSTLFQPLLSRSSSPAPSIHTTSPPTEPLTTRSASSLPAQYPPRNATTDPSPSVESQGFALYISSAVAWFAYLIWSFLPDRYLELLGIEWYPSREWSLLIPAWTVTLAFFTYFFYISINIFITPSPTSWDTLTDPFAFILKPTAEDPFPLISNSILLPKDAVPPIHDLPVSLVNKIVFGDHRRKRGSGWGSRKKGMGGVELERERRKERKKG